MAQAGLRESFLSFRMWRLNHRVSTYKPSLRNPFFLESYIYSFIEELIHKKLHFPEEKRSYDFRQFAHLLKDYVKLVRDRKEEFSFGRYREYFDFRSKHEKFEEGLATNRDIIYDKNFFLEYAHSEFVEGNKLAVKKYRKYQEGRKLQEEERASSFRKAAETLKNEIQ
jgi:squalene cyclase